jgi:5-methylcytosine-specific restriction protein B
MPQTTIKELHAIWDSFLTRWPVSAIQDIELGEYVDTNNNDTLAYWLEHVTRKLGSIRGGDSSKFGIYRRLSEPTGQRSHIRHGDMYSWKLVFGETEETAFASIKKELNHVVDAAIRGDLKTIQDSPLANTVKWKLAFLYQDRQHPIILNIFKKSMLQSLVNMPNGNFVELYGELLNHKGSRDILDYGRGLWSIDSTAAETEELQEQKLMSTSLNTILFGPPGTGKTYHTIEAAVTAVRPDFEWEDREDLKLVYEELVQAGRINFVTFHQSYGYEEFVEGLTAKENSQGNVTYPVKDGVFKRACLNAVSPTTNQEIVPSAKIWQLSIESSGQSKVKDICLESNLGAIGWGHVGDMSPHNRTQDTSAALAEESKPNQATIRSFCNEMALGDIVFCVSGQKTIEAIGVVSGDYIFREQGFITRNDYNHTRPITWLAKGLDLNVFELNKQTLLPIKTCSELTRFTVKELLAFLAENAIDLGLGGDNTDENHVLIIDEINRGNISKIFGELITLIEPSKRAGQEEALEVVLPYSGKKLSVPNNLYIIGTMNTADRSLAMMDTALRRRFDFKEMMPAPELFENKTIKGIDLTQLLKTLNERIEALYDREHMLGHAFLFPAFNAEDEDEAFAELKFAFKNKILPLLEEYFYEDWNKVRLVLGDNQKNPELAFIDKIEKSYNTLFGNDHGLDTYEEATTTYKLKPFVGANSIWDDPQAYIEIYASTKTAS